MNIVCLLCVRFGHSFYCLHHIGTVWSTPVNFEKNKNIVRMLTDLRIFFKKLQLPGAITKIKTINYEGVSNILFRLYLPEV